MHAVVSYCWEHIEVSILEEMEQYDLAHRQLRLSRRWLQRARLAADRSLLLPVVADGEQRNEQRSVTEHAPGKVETQQSP